MASEVILRHPDNPDERDVRITGANTTQPYLDAGWVVVGAVAETPEDPGQPAPSTDVDLDDEADERTP